MRNKWLVFIGIMLSLLLLSSCLESEFGVVTNSAILLKPKYAHVEDLKGNIDHFDLYVRFKDELFSFKDINVQELEQFKRFPLKPKLEYSKCEIPMEINLIGFDYAKMPIVQAKYETRFYDTILFQLEPILEKAKITVEIQPENKEPEVFQEIKYEITDFNGKLIVEGSMKNDIIYGFGLFHETKILIPPGNYYLKYEVYENYGMTPIKGGEIVISHIDALNSFIATVSN